HARASQAQQEIQQLARPLFDVRSAARRVLEPGWNTLSVVQREEFVRLFGDHLLWGYLSLVRGRLSRDRPPTIRLVAEEVVGGWRRRSAAREQDGRRRAYFISSSPARRASERRKPLTTKGRCGIRPSLAAASRMLQCASRARETPNGRDRRFRCQTRFA